MRLIAIAIATHLVPAASVKLNLDEIISHAFIPGFANTHFLYAL